MDSRDAVMLAGTVLGGLAMFMFGMSLMSDGLRELAGVRLGHWLNRATRRPLVAYGLGAALAALMHSGAVTVMLVGVAHAGLLSLARAVPVVLGASLGTTFSMWVLSFRVGDYGYFLLALGFLLNVASPRTSGRIGGRAMMGFALLFLGMNIMSGAAGPYRDLLQPWFAGIGGGGLAGMFAGIGVSLLITILIQSSGATLGMVYALAHAGALTDLTQTYPIVLGAAIGTCSTALLSSIGTRIEARRVAFSHLLFNLVAVALAAAAQPLAIRALRAMTDDVAQQTALLHVGMMLIAGLAVLAVAPAFAWIVHTLIHSRTPERHGSYLNDELLDRPELALQAVIRELGRVAAICAESFHLTADLMLFEAGHGRVEQVRRNEDAIDQIKRAMKDYLARITERYLSRRQTLLIQHLDRCMIDIERIGDHLESLCDLSLSRKKEPKAVFDEESLQRLFELHGSATRVFQVVLKSLNPDNRDFHGMAREIRDARDAYLALSVAVRQSFTEKLERKETPPIAGIYYSEYVAGFDRIVRHSNNIALAESQPDFWIKESKLDKVAPPAAPVEPPPLVKPQDFLAKFHQEKYL